MPASNVRSATTDDLNLLRLTSIVRAVGRLLVMAADRVTRRAFVNSLVATSNRTPSEPLDSIGTANVAASASMANTTSISINVNPEIRRQRLFTCALIVRLGR